ncbi:PhzF family phenazine biosynthesis protein [Gordonia neofelifaecis]|uniref:PhzF family phenazine biosynthesis protein n=1 Tax=Gordonia neofelifaecis NRRL B-59395 TaxID=644548 RepID=F1YKV3_9ACTN|nr:PhzF family phenazine biosynthesis protein [Gordonia neofelifaecis]EGD54747.1 PhzF family phenazine biosynthesis protein [Gordonia neofelifaecis NRRL B-59395]
MTHDFAQVDVFTTEPTRGNPVAVVFGADGLSDEQMAAFARWTNLSETTFLLAPTDPAADYRLRIFTPGGELPFAGHPTLGSAHAWLEAGGVPAGDDLVQECGIGLVTIRREPGAGRLAFAAPPLVRSGPVDEATMTTVRDALGLAPDDVTDANWVCNGPEWLGVLVSDGQRVLDIEPDFAALGDLEVGVIGPWSPEEAAARGADYEVRAFVPELGVPEDPVTGSLNAGFAVWLRAAGVVPASYVVAQGTALHRAGRVQVDDDGGRIWIGGSSITVISGTVDLSGKLNR